jgi:A/G-specific adenine glycosylase
VGQLIGRYDHAYTHFRITLHAFLCTLAADANPQPLEGQALVWVRMNDLPDYPMGKVDRQIAKQIMKAGNDGSI